MTLAPDGQATGCGHRPQVGPVKVGSTPGTAAQRWSLYGSFGGCLLSQEHTPIVRLRPVSRRRVGYVFSSTFQYASLMNFDQLSIRTRCAA